MIFDRFRILGWLIPVACCATSGWLVFQANLAFRNSNEVRNRAHIEAQQALQQRKLIDGLPTERRYATVVNSPTEDYSFATYFKQSAQACGVTLSNWTVQTTDMGKESASAKALNADPLMKGIEKIDTSVTLTGPYNRLRSLVSLLESSDRLFALSNLVWIRTPDGTSLTMSISRYVTPIKVPVAPVEIKQS